MKKYLLPFLFLSIIATFTDVAMAASSKKEINTPNAPAPIGTYSQAVQFGDTVYIAGQIPVNPATGNLVTEDFSAQAKQAFINVLEIAKAAGGNSDDILKLTIYLTDLSNFTTVNTVMGEFFKPPYPARAAIEIKGLPKGAPIEIEAVMGLSK